MLQVHKN